MNAKHRDVLHHHKTLIEGRKKILSKSPKVYDHHHIYRDDSSFFFQVYFFPKDLLLIRPLNERGSEM
jgi:hypothetical protein